MDIEASVSYHRLLLEILLVGARFLEVAGRMPSERYRKRLVRMFDFVDVEFFFCAAPGAEPFVTESSVVFRWSDGGM